MGGWLYCSSGGHVSERIMGECYRIMLKHLSCQHLRDCENQEFKASLNFIERLSQPPSNHGVAFKEASHRNVGQVFQTRAGVGHRVGQRGQTIRQGPGQGLGGHGSSFL